MAVRKNRVEQFDAAAPLLVRPSLVIRLNNLPLIVAEQASTIHSSGGARLQLASLAAPG
jgi:hypothetical protein